MNISRGHVLSARRIGRLQDNRNFSTSRIDLLWTRWDRAWRNTEYKWRTFSHTDHFQKPWQSALSHSQKLHRHCGWESWDWRLLIGMHAIFLLEKPSGESLGTISQKKNQWLCPLLSIHLPNNESNHQYHHRHGEPSSMSSLNRYFCCPHGTFTYDSVMHHFSQLTYVIFVTQCLLSFFLLFCVFSFFNHSNVNCMFNVKRN